MNNKPVAWMRKSGEEIFLSKTDHSASNKWIPLYTHPVKELTDEEILDTFNAKFDYLKTDEVLIEFARAILRKTQEK